MSLLPDAFTVRRVPAGELSINCAVAGDGPPVLMLHGYPESHVMWHRVAPELARTHTVVLADLRGYGDSDKPAPSDDAREYGNRVMAADQVALMAALGHERFALVGHDRGARVGLRLAHDAPGAVTRFAAMDIVPARYAYAHVDREMADRYYHWFLLSQPDRIAETLIAGAPGAWVRATIDRLAGTELAPAPVAEYVRHFGDPATVAATTADYRAGVGIDADHDEQTARAGDRLACPVLVMWGTESFVDTYDVPAAWADDVSDPETARIPCGHFLPEEAPEIVLDALAPFLAG